MVVNGHKLISYEGMDTFIREGQSLKAMLPMTTREVGKLTYVKTMLSKKKKKKIVVLQRNKYMEKNDSRSGDLQ